MLYHPGQVRPVSLLVARINNAPLPPWLNNSTSHDGILPDMDISNNYGDSLCNHLSWSLTGIHTNVVLWGDNQWVTTHANNEVCKLLHRIVTSLQYKRQMQIPPGNCVVKFVSQIFDTCHGKLHTVAECDASVVTSAFQQCLPSSNTRYILISKLVISHLVPEWEECSISILVPPSFDGCTHDVHRCFRNEYEALFAVNSLNAVCLHVDKQGPLPEDVLVTLRQLKQKTCAPIPNSQAAMHLAKILKKKSEQVKLMEADFVNLQKAYSMLQMKLQQHQNEETKLVLQSQKIYQPLVSASSGIKILSTGQQSSSQSVWPLLERKPAVVESTECKEHIRHRHRHHQDSHRRSRSRSPLRKHSHQHRYRSISSGTPRRRAHRRRHSSSLSSEAEQSRSKWDQPPTRREKPRREDRKRKRSTAPMQEKSTFFPNVGLEETAPTVVTTSSPLGNPYSAVLPRKKVIEKKRKKVRGLSSSSSSGGADGGKMTKEIPSVLSRWNQTISSNSGSSGEDSGVEQYLAAQREALNGSGREGGRY